MRTAKTDQTGRMPRLIWVFAGRTCHFLGFVMRQLTWTPYVCLCWGLTSQSTIFQSCRDGATASWVNNQYFRGVKCLAQGHNTAAVGLEPPTSRSGVRHSTTEPPRSPDSLWHFAEAWKILKVKVNNPNIIRHFNVTGNHHRLQVLTSHMDFNPSFTTGQKAKFRLLPVPVFRQNIFEIFKQEKKKKKGSIYPDKT